MNNIRILADDLTGALDSAARFVPYADTFDVSWLSAPDRCGGAVFDTETRNMNARQAAASVAAAAPWLEDAAISFKKIDSQLRGPVAAEIAVLSQSGRFASVSIAPAFPTQGRRTSDGCQWVQDPGTSGWRKVGPDLGVQLARLGLEVNHAHAAEAARTSFASGLTLWDASTDRDLDALAAAGSAAPGHAGSVLWCGSAGLAGALARNLMDARGPGVSGNAAAIRSLPAPLLFIVGTARPAMLRQTARLMAGDAKCRINAGEDDALTLRNLRGRLAGATYALLTFDLREGLSEAEAGAIIRQRLRAVLTRLPPPGSLFVSGGETLHAALDILGAGGIRVCGEFEPGIALGRLTGGRFDQVHLVSKSGAFGTTDILVRIAASMRSKRANSTIK
jgi:uncharacterized protein YgbK (DUF1537 family)